MLPLCIYTGANAEPWSHLSTEGSAFQDMCSEVKDVVQMSHFMMKRNFHLAIRLGSMSKQNTHQQHFLYVIYILDNNKYFQTKYEPIA